MRYMLHTQAVSLNCVHYYYNSISIAHFTHDYHFSILIAMFGGTALIFVPRFTGLMHETSDFFTL